MMKLLMRCILWLFFCLWIKNAFATNAYFSFHQTNDKATLRLIDQNQVIFSLKVKSIPEKKNLYHWTNENWARMIDAEGGVSQDEMIKMQKSGLLRNHRQFGGYYVSTSRKDSRRYGISLLTLFPPRPIYMVSFHKLKKFNILDYFQNSPMKLQRALKLAGISATYQKHLSRRGIHYWLNIFDSSVTTHISTKN